MDVNPTHKNLEKFRGGVQMNMLSSKDLPENIRFKLKTESGDLVWFNGQSVIFKLSILKVFLLSNDELKIKITIYSWNKYLKHKQ